VTQLRALGRQLGESIYLFHTARDERSTSWDPGVVEVEIYLARRARHLLDAPSGARYSRMAAVAGAARERYAGLLSAARSLAHGGELFAAVATHAHVAALLCHEYAAGDVAATLRRLAPDHPALARADELQHVCGIIANAARDPALLRAAVALCAALPKRAPEAP
jgi:hypothetical protein